MRLNGIISLTWVSGQVLEVHWLADLAVRGPAELHLDINGLIEVSGTVRRCAKHNGHLPVDISLGKTALPLPGILEETYFDVLCRGREKGTCQYICINGWSLSQGLMQEQLTVSLLSKNSWVLHHLYCYATPSFTTACKPRYKLQLLNLRSGVLCSK